MGSPEHQAMFRKISLISLNSLSVGHQRVKGREAILKSTWTRTAEAEFQTLDLSYSSNRLNDLQRTDTSVRRLRLADALQCIRSCTSLGSSSCTS